MKYRRFWIAIFITIFFLYLIVFIYTLKRPEVAKIGDAGEYIQEAENILEYKSVYCGDFNMEVDFDLMTRRPPLYPFILSMSLLVFDNAQLILLLQLFLTFLNGLLIYRITGYYDLSSHWRLILTIIFLLYPSQLIFTNIIMSEVVLQSFLLGAFYHILKYNKTGKLYYLLFYNLCLVATVLTKPIFLYFWIPNIIFHGWFYIRDRKKTILILPLIFIFTISCWSYRNYRQTGVFHYSSIKIHNLLRYNIQGFLANKYDTEKAEQFIAQINRDAAAKTSYSEQYRFLENKSYDIIFDNFFLYLMFHIKGTINFFIDPGRFDVYNFLQLDSSVSMLKLYHQYGFSAIFHIFRKIPLTLLMYFAVMTIINFMFLGALIYFSITPNRNRCYKIFLLTICMYVALLTGPIGASRFRLPILPFLVLTLPVVIELFVQRSRQANFTEIVTDMSKQ